MTLIAYGEIHFLNGDATLFARFAQGDDGASFDLPLSAEQFQVLLSGIGDAQPTQTPQAKAASYEEDDEVDDARPFAVAAGGHDDDDDL